MLADFQNSFTVVFPEEICFVSMATEEFIATLMGQCGSWSRGTDFAFLYLNKRLCAVASNQRLSFTWT